MRQYITYWSKISDRTDLPKQQTLSFDIFDDPISQSWCEVVERKIRLGDTAPQGYSNHGVFPAQENREDIAKELAEHVSVAKEFRPELEWPKDIYDIDQDKLNYLHERFHETEENFFRNQYGPLDTPEDFQRVKDAFIKINHLIHSLERVIQWENLPSRFKKNRQSYYVLNFGIYKESLFNPVTSDMRKYFKHQYHSNQKNVHLLLGYNTIGKNLSHCANDNDYTVVKDNMIRPQMHIGSEAILVVRYGKWPTTQADVNLRQKKEIKKIKDFVKRNNLESYLKWYKPEYLYGVQPQIGVVSDFHDNWTEQNYYNLTKNYILEKVELI